MDGDPSEAMKRAGMKGEFSFYSLWYGGDVDTRIINSAVVSKGNALMIGDSYSDAFRWVVAKDYQELLGYMDLHSSSVGEEYLCERLESLETDDIYFVGSVLDFSDMLDRHPDYFE